MRCSFSSQVRQPGSEAAQAVCYSLTMALLAESGGGRGFEVALAICREGHAAGILAHYRLPAAPAPSPAAVGDASAGAAGAGDGGAAGGAAGAGPMSPVVNPAAPGGEPLCVVDLRGCGMHEALVVIVAWWLTIAEADGCESYAWFRLFSAIVHNQ